MIFIPSSYWPLTGHVTEQTDDLALRTKEKKSEEEKNESSETKGLNYHSQNQLVHRKVRELRTDLYCHEEKELIFHSFHIGITPGFVSFK